MQQLPLPGLRIWCVRGFVIVMLLALVGVSHKPETCTRWFLSYRRMQSRAISQFSAYTWAPCGAISRLRAVMGLSMLALECSAPIAILPLKSTNRHCRSKQTMLSERSIRMAPLRTNTLTHSRAHIETQIQTHALTIPFVFVPLWLCALWLFFFRSPQPWVADSFSHRLSFVVRLAFKGRHYIKLSSRSRRRTALESERA